jgi:hypothetical protein
MKPAALVLNEINPGSSSPLYPIWPGIGASHEGPPIPGCLGWVRQ